jgi:hypothetical protein
VHHDLSITTTPTTIRKYIPFMDWLSFELLKFALSTEQNLGYPDSVVQFFQIPLYAEEGMAD